MVRAGSGCIGAATSARSGRQSSARHSCLSPTTSKCGPPAFAWRTGTATAVRTSSRAVRGPCWAAKASTRPGPIKCGSTFAAVAENADVAGPNKALHLTGAAILVSRGMKVLQAAPAGELCRSAIRPGDCGMVPIPYALTYKTTLRGRVPKLVRCEKCSFEYVYLLEMTVAGEGTS